MRLKVGMKFASISVLSILLILTAATVGIVELRLLGEHTVRLAASSEANQYAHRLRLDLQELYTALNAGVTKNNLAALGEPLQEPLGKVSTDVINLNRVLSEQGATDRVREITELHTTLLAEAETLRMLVSKDEWNTAYVRLVNFLDPIESNFDAHISRVEIEAQREALEATQFVRQARSSYMTAILIVAGIAMVLLALASWLLWRDLVEPIHRLTVSASMLASGNLDSRTNIVDRQDEIGALAIAFDSMADQLAASHRSLAEKVQQRTAELEAEHTALQDALTSLQASTAERERLLATLAQLQNPVIPVIEGVVVAPIVGQLNTQRLEQLQQTLLDTVASTRARVALLDITGVPALDEHDAARLLQVGHALRLLGAMAILVGVRPEVAQTLVVQGTNIDNICTAIDLQRGIDVALRIVQRKIVTADVPLRDGTVSALRMV
jgi:anti-anti-sigma regulatory factor/HAMP domain-containing protein